MEYDQKLSAAIQFAQKGFHIFPVKPDRKSPPLLKRFPEYATRDQSEIRKFAIKHPNCNFAASTSQFGETEALVVVDVDPKKGGIESLIQSELDGKFFPPTFAQSTPSGGEHLVYRTKMALKQGVDVLGPGIDIRSKSGYILIAGSTYNGIPYLINRDLPIANAPEWLVEACGQPRVKSPEPPSLAGINTYTAESRAIDYLRNHAPVSIENSGGDHTAFRVAARVKDFGVIESRCIDLLMEHWNWRCEPPWPGEELETKVKNAYKYGVQPCGVEAAELQFSKIEDNLKRPHEGSSNSHLFFEKFSEIQTNFAESSLVQGLLDQKGMSLVFGDSNSGKTFWALDLGLHISMNRKWFDRQVFGGTVIYVAAEGGGAIRKRIHAFKIFHNLTKEELPFALVPCPCDLLDPKADTLPLISLIQNIETELNSPVRLVVVDTLSRTLAGGNENASEDMSAFIRNVDLIRNRTSSHVMVIHHSGKDRQKGARGHSSLKAATDTEIEILSGRARITKQRDLESSEDIYFSLQVIELGLGHASHPITSCVVRPGTNNVSVRKQLKKNSNAEKAFSVLIGLITKVGKSPNRDLDLSMEQLVISVDEWRSAFLGQFFNTSTNAKTRYSAFSRAMENLVKSGHIGEKDNYIYVL